MPEEPSFPTTHTRCGSLDGTGAGDHDQPFGGFRAYLLSTRQLARLLQLRSECLEARLGRGRWAGDLVGSH
jgi:hypothetical protein